MQFNRTASAVGLTAGLLATAVAAHAEFSFDDIEFYVGEGANTAGFVIDWNDGLSPETLAWGYRWDGVATGYDMLAAIVMTDSRLYSKLTENEFGIFVNGFGYDLDNDGFALDDGTTFDNGIAFVDPTDGAQALDPDDHYQEGWVTDGFWGYYNNADGNPYLDGTWEFADLGMIDRVLNDGDWDGWSFAVDLEPSVPGLPVAAEVPAPGTLALLVIAAFGCNRQQRRRRC